MGNEKREIRKGKLEKGLPTYKYFSTKAGYDTFIKPKGLFWQKRVGKWSYEKVAEA